MSVCLVNQRVYNNLNDEICYQRSENLYDSLTRLLENCVVSSITLQILPSMVACLWKGLCSHTNAVLVPILTVHNKRVDTWQILPGQDDMDGFFYAKLTKKIKNRQK